MKILFDLTYVNPSSVSGVSIYIFRLLNGFAQLNYSSKIILLVTGENKKIIKEQCPSFSTIVMPIKKGKLFNQFHVFKGYFHLSSINRIIKDAKIDLLFSPYLHTGSLFTNSIPQVGVMHDAQSYIFFKDSGLKGSVYNSLYIKLLKRMKKIVTISNFAKSSILEEIPLLNVSISVIYNSVVKTELDEDIKFSNYSPYILFVNTLMPYKNLETLVKAFALIKDKISHNLVVKAKRLPYWDNVIIPILKNNSILDRVLLIEDNYNDEKMAALYNEANLFVTPSKMEGFGFTPIEAAMYETPVISSKESALYETTMGLLNYYEPVDDYDKLAKVILDITSQNNTNGNLINISNTYIDVYSSSKQAKSFLKLFEEIMRKK